VDGVTRPVPLWQRKLQVDRARRRKLTENGTNSEDLVEDEDVYFFLVEVLQVSYRIYFVDNHLELVSVVSPNKLNFNQL